MNQQKQNKFRRNEMYVDVWDSADVATKTKQVPPESIVGGCVRFGGCSNKSKTSSAAMKSRRVFEMRRMKQQKQNKNKFRRNEM